MEKTKKLIEAEERFIKKFNLTNIKEIDQDRYLQLMLILKEYELLDIDEWTMYNINVVKESIVFTCIRYHTKLKDDILSIFTKKRMYYVDKCNICGKPVRYKQYGIENEVLCKECYKECRTIELLDSHIVYKVHPKHKDDEVGKLINQMIEQQELRYKTEVLLVKAAQKVKELIKGTVNV
jgi:hypothetical protein